MIDAQTTEISLTRMLWSALGGEEPALASLRFSGPAGGLPSRFRVGELAVAAIAVATVAAAELWGRRRDKPVARVVVDRRLAAAAFRSEGLLQSVGWQRPAMWDAIAGDYTAADGWIRLHTNYSYHRDAVTRVLGVPAQRERVAEAVRSRRATELETEVVDAGGCAAALRSADAWREHQQGRALASEPLCEWSGEGARPVLSADEDAPLAGVRVLDLTRVIAGPIATRYLAGFGAQVLRIDPPGFDEVAGLLPLTTQGKRCAALDLRKDRAAFEALLADATVLVHGYRPGAMEAMGYSSDALRALNPRLVVVRYDAYGWTGPWAGRRGFDSLVQMSSGIAHPGDASRPTPLPAQALDHATGYLAAAAAMRALVDGRSQARLSLARTARLLIELGSDGDPHAPALTDIDALLEPTDTAWGPVRVPRPPASIEGYEVRWRENAGPIGRHPPRWP